MRICFCGNAVFGTDKNTKIGYCKTHQYKRTDLDKRSILVKGLEKAKRESRRFYLVDAEPIKNELDNWFEYIHNKLKGTCVNCGGKTQKGKDNYKSSIAHILPKAYFPSVSIHPLNFIELCFYGNSCHTNMDNKILDLIDMNCFDEIVEKVTKIYPSIAQEEKRRIPKILLEYIKIEI